MTRRRDPTPDELRLWRVAMSETKPLDPTKVPPLPPLPPKPLPEPEAPKPPAPPAPAAPPPAPSPAPHAARRQAHPSLTLDTRLRRDISRGKIEIDRRVDLHGLTREAAHHTLVSFLAGARAQGARVVLVITGKGAPEGASDDDMPFHAWMGGGRRPPGVIRRALPGWLADPSLRPLVVGYAQADRRHGGDGAVYVVLRRDKRRDE